MASVEIIGGPALGRRFGLGQRSVMVGRDPSCQIRIWDDQISRRHLQIVCDPSSERHAALDVGSANGVWVNGVRLERGSQRLLEDGDEIRIGQSRLRYTGQGHGHGHEFRQG